MIVTVTYLKLRNLRQFFRLSYFGLKISRQANARRGFIKMKNTGFGYRHYTLSVWESVEDLKSFAQSGEHLEAMKWSRKLAAEIRIYTFETERVPNWKEAKKMVYEHGKIFSFE